VVIIFVYRGLANACSGASMRCAYLSVRAAAALISAAVCLFSAHAQQQPLPVVGYLSFTSPDERPTLVAAFRQGLQQAGFVVGQNVAIEYRSAGGKSDRLPALAAELAKIPTAVIAATGGEAVARAARAATSQIPIVFTSSSDVVKGGLVASLNRPGGNVTGVSLLGYELDSKRLQLLRELLPQRSTIGVLMDANNPVITATLSQMKTAADANGQRLVVLDARTEVDIDATFASLRSKGVDALLVTTNPFYEGRRDDIVALAKRHSVPALYPWREYSVAGGLISYGTSFTESYRQAGLYVGRILKGEKPADLPVVQATKFELLVNIKTAKSLGLTVPPSILVSADEVIE
jgi:putative tryptophan/tyrosine transport system substrate-binding protein